MIDMHNETLLAIAEVSDHVPTHPHVATVWRWIQKGIRGVRLESVLIGGMRYTSKEALQRFFEGSNASTNGTQSRRTQPVRKQAAIEAAEREFA
jgi:hypothetical protein